MRSNRDSVDPRQQLRTGGLLSLATDVESAYQERPDDESAVRALSVVRWRQGRRDEAWLLVCEALESHPDSSGLRNELARMQAELGDLEGAERNWQYVLSIQPESDEARFMWGAALISAKRWRKAITVLPKVVRDSAYRKPVFLLHMAALVGIMGGPVLAVGMTAVSVVGLVLLLTGRVLPGAALASTPAGAVLVAGLISRDKRLTRLGALVTVGCLVVLTGVGYLLSVLRPVP